MELKGSRLISADRGTVWAALNDAEVLKACIPGCTELTGNPVEGFEAKVQLALQKGALLWLYRMLMVAQSLTIMWTQKWGGNWLSWDRV